MGDVTDLVWGRIFFQTSLEFEIFSPVYNGVRFFFSIIRPERYFSVQDIFCQEFICMLFSPGNQSAGHFF